MESKDEELITLILLLYYNRPKMVRYALESIRDAAPLWELAFIDDGSEFPGKNIMYDILQNCLCPIKVYESSQSSSQKIADGESMFGTLMNQAIKESSADLVIMLCDDDALYPGYLQYLSKFFKENPTLVSCYSHVHLFNPLIESPAQALVRSGPGDFTGVKWSGNSLNAYSSPISPENHVDSSQVAWRRSIHEQFGIWFPKRQTRSLDAAFYAQLFQHTGYTPFSGCIGQFKGWHPKQLSFRPQAFVVDLHEVDS